MNVLTLPATSDMSESASDHLLATLLYNNGLLFLDRGHPEEALRLYVDVAIPAVSFGRPFAGSESGPQSGAVCPSR
ncbi:MAG: hypothetical protein ACFHWZ_06830 [Phycisphaerales bacterium]